MTLEEQIIEVIGKNHKRPFALTEVKHYHEVHAIYSYKSQVFCLKNGDDIPFVELTVAEQKTIHDFIKADKYKLTSKSFQG